MTLTLYLFSVIRDDKAINIYIHISVHKDTCISEGSVSKSGIYGS